MVTAFLLVNAEIGSEIEVLRVLKTIDTVEFAYLVYGVYDIVVKMKTESMDAIKEIISSRLIRSNVVKSCTTMIVIPEKQNFNMSREEVATITV